MDKFTVEFGQRVKERRKLLGMTQLDLAIKMGFKSKQAISHIEAGDRNLKQSQVSALAEALNVTPAYLMGWEEPEQKKTVTKIHELIDRIPESKQTAVLDFLQSMFPEN